mgnify:CR=1 FL=1
MKHNFTLLYTLNIKKSTDFNNILGVFGAGAKKHLMLSGTESKNISKDLGFYKQSQKIFNENKNVYKK